MLKKLYKNTIGRMICFFMGHWGIVDTLRRRGTCTRCGGVYNVEYDMKSDGRMIWVERVKKQ